MFAGLAVASAALLPSNAQIRILSQKSDIQPDGSYQYSYETENGIAAGESGVGGVAANGFQQWTSPEGLPVQIQYRADENGYQPQGSVLPVGPAPPPIPPAILRALEWIRTHPSNDDGQYRARPLLPVQQQRFF